MTLLTFLGTGNYQTATYQPCDFSSFANRQGTPLSPHESRFFSAALAHWSQPDRVIVITTPEASEKHGDAIKKELSDYQTTLLELPLQTGTESDLWYYFQTLTQALEDGEEIIADITHGFRSTPVVTLLALTFLRITRSINLRGLYYGAFDSVPRGEKIPTFDLSPFVDLLQWTTAAGSFFQTGDATQLSALVHHAQKSLWADRSRDKSENPRTLIPLASAIHETSADLRLLRLQDLANSTQNLASKIQRASPELDAFLPPFAELIRLVSSELTRHSSAALAHPNPEASIPDQTDLSSQLELIHWLLEKGHTISALTLAREWIVTAFALHLVPDSPPPLVYSLRKPYENLLNFLTNPKASALARKIDPQLLEAWDRFLPALQRKFETTWSQTTAPRNDLNHANHNDTSHKASALATTVSSLLDQLNFLLPENLTPDS